MSEDNEAFLAELRQVIEEAQPAQPVSQNFITCVCGKRLRQFTVKKSGPNQGRPFASCEGCKRFQWLDCATCPKCGERCYRATVRKEGPNKGRRFESCPNQCKGVFKWLS